MEQDRPEWGAVMIPWIQNISTSDVIAGVHRSQGNTAILIQIGDPGTIHPTPKCDFREVHKFWFLDTEDSTDSSSISPADAHRLVDLLRYALEYDINVVSNCNAGVCRSGAVAEVGIMMGFRDLDAFRCPNLLVKHSLLRALEWHVNEDEVHSVNGVPLRQDWSNDNEKVFILARERKKHRERFPCARVIDTYKTEAPFEFVEGTAWPTAHRTDPVYWNPPKES